MYCLNGPWVSVGSSSFVWFDGSVEHFDSTFTAPCSWNGIMRQLVIAFTDRDAAGKADRRRAVVFFGEVGKALFPIVEFAGANDLGNSGVLASVVKHASRKHVRPGQLIPSEYQNIPLVPYRDVVNGPYAARSLAVKAHKDDLSLMATHAFLRALQRAWL